MTQTSKRLAAIGILSLLFAAATQAQSTSIYSGPGGAGAGVSGMLGVGLPKPGEGNGAPAMASGASATQLRATLTALNSGQPQTIGIGGQAFTVAGSTLQQVGAVMGGAAPSNVGVFIAALLTGGVGRAEANALAKALALVGSSGATVPALIEATTAFNAAASSVAASAPVPPIVLAVRAALGPLLGAP